MISWTYRQEIYFFAPTSAYFLSKWSITPIKDKAKRHDLATL